MNTVSDLAAVAMASVSKATQGSLQKNNSFAYIVATHGSQAVATRGCLVIILPCVETAYNTPRVTIA